MSKHSLRVWPLLFVTLSVVVSVARAQWLVTTVPADSWPISLCHNTQNDYVYCANWGGDNVTVIGGAADSVITTVAVGEEPHAVIYNPVNNKVF